MPIVSTVPGAILTLAQYMQNVADANPDLNPGVYTGGIPTASVRKNFMMIGNYDTGVIITPETYHWNAVPGNAKLRGESYALQGCIRAWSGAAGQAPAIARITDAFTLLNALHEQIISDVGANLVTTAALSPSGSWGDLDVSMDENGPLGGEGWGVVLGFELHVINAQLIG